MLGLYARHFTAVEVDATYYRVLPPRTFASMAQRTPAGFRFAAKLPGTATHVPEALRGTVHDDVAAFRNSIEPLREAGKFACALMQFPNSFRPGPESNVHIEALRDALPDIALVAEFRHREWQTAETLDLLRSLRIGWCNVDEPRFSTLLHASADATAQVAYVRFHGRSAKTWYKGDSDARYDYLYPPEELEPWAHRVADLTTDPEVREVYAFFNNHRRGQATRNAEEFEAMLSGLLDSVARVDAAGRPPPSGEPPSGEQLDLNLK